MAIARSVQTWKNKTEENIELRKQQSEERQKKLHAAFKLISTVKRLHGEAAGRLQAIRDKRTQAEAYAIVCKERAALKIEEQRQAAAIEAARLEALAAVEAAKSLQQRELEAAYEANSLWAEDHPHPDLQADLAALEIANKYEKRMQKRRKKKKQSMSESLQLALATYSSATKRERGKLQKEWNKFRKVNNGMLSAQAFIEIEEDQKGNDHKTFSQLKFGGSASRLSVVPFSTVPPPKAPNQMPRQQASAAKSKNKNKSRVAPADTPPPSSARPSHQYSEGFEILRQLSNLGSQVSKQSADLSDTDLDARAVTPALRIRDASDPNISGLQDNGDMVDAFAMLESQFHLDTMVGNEKRVSMALDHEQHTQHDITKTKLINRTISREMSREMSTLTDAAGVTLSPCISETSFDGAAPHTTQAVSDGSSTVKETAFDYIDVHAHDMEEVDLDAGGTALPGTPHERPLSSRTVDQIKRDRKKGGLKRSSTSSLSMAIMCAFSACIALPGGTDGAAPAIYPELYEATAKVGQLTYSRFGGDLKALVKWYDLDDSDTLELKNADGVNEFESMFAHSGIGSSITRESWSKGFVRSFDTGGDCATHVEDEKIHLDEMVKGFARLGFAEGGDWLSFRPKVTHSQGWIDTIAQPTEYDEWLCLTTDGERNAGRWPNLAEIERTASPAINDHNKLVAPYTACSSDGFATCMKDAGTCELCYLQKGCRVMNRLSHVAGNLFHGSRLIVAKDFVDTVRQVERFAALCSASIFVVTGFHRETDANSDAEGDQKAAQLSGHSLQFYLEYLGGGGEETGAVSSGLCDSDCFAKGDDRPPQAACFDDKIKNELMKLPAFSEVVWDHAGKGFGKRVGSERSIPTIYLKSIPEILPKGGAVCGADSKLSSNHCCDEASKVTRPGEQKDANKVPPIPWCADTLAMDSKGPGTLDERYKGIDLEEQETKAREDIERAHDFGCMNTVIVETSFNEAIHDRTGNGGAAGSTLKQAYKDWCVSQLADPTDELDAEEFCGTGCSDCSEGIELPDTAAYPGPADVDGKLVLQVLETDTEVSPNAFPEELIASKFPELVIPSYTEVQTIQEEGFSSVQVDVKTNVLSGPLIDAKAYRPQSFIAPNIQVGTCKTILLLSTFLSRRCARACVCVCMYVCVCVCVCVNSDQ